MKTIMLVCNAGMSTSMLVTKMKKAAMEKGVDVEIFAIPVSEVAEQVASKAIDVILVGPQVKFMVSQYKKDYEPKIKVDSINMQDYGVMNGEKVLETALKMLAE
ncbi:PTS sugar transporter subunit IIB [Atopobacter sp. AH10]|uniref:PTS sugar transporter subunit IIB n=1 Tax=Atopobacter sp. AH10 TaxID=2315861 RepID=UPI000EF25753|nr:PTS sugar transporter subunit IIB [Atopobacter sp. AH10]RLK63449.1 PTS sugar transporter subunit IIB [Atopobacter sp. AH10]